MIQAFVVSLTAFCRHDRKLGGVSTPVSDNSAQPSIPTQQFGVTLQYIKQQYNVGIPPVVKQCVDYLDKPDGEKYSVTCILGFKSVWAELNK